MWTTLFLLGANAAIFLIGMWVGEMREQRWPTPEPGIERCSIPLPPKETTNKETNMPTIIRAIIVKDLLELADYIGEQAIEYETIAEKHPRQADRHNATHVAKGIRLVEAIVRDTEIDQHQQGES